MVHPRFEDHTHFDKPWNDMVCKKASLLLNVNTLVGNDRTNSIFIYQTWIFCKKIGSNRSFLPEIGAQTFCYIPWGVATAYSIDIANWVGQSTKNCHTWEIANLQFWSLSEWRPSVQEMLAHLKTPKKETIELDHNIFGNWYRIKRIVRKLW